MTSSQPDFSLALRKERHHHNLTQSDLAEQLGTSPKTVARWEAGKRFPTIYSRRHLSRVFGKDLLAPQLDMPLVLSYSQLLPSGQCEESKVTIRLDMLVINPCKNQTLVHLYINNDTTEDLTLRMGSVSLIGPTGIVMHGQSIGSFQVGAGQTIPFSAIFEGVPKQGTSYNFILTLLRPKMWHNTYQPVSLVF